MTAIKIRVAQLPLVYTPHPMGICLSNNMSPPVNILTLWELPFKTTSHKY